MIKNTPFVLLITAWLLPNHYFPWLAAYQDFLIFFSLILFFCIIYFEYDKVRLPKYFVIALLFSLIPLAQYLVGIVQFFGDALIASVYLIGFFLSLCIGYNAEANSTKYNNLALSLSYTFIIGAVLSIWLALLQWLLLSGSIWVADLPPNARPFANLAQPNNLATLICLGLAGLIYLYEIKKTNILSSGLLAIFLIFGLALTQSRTPWVASFLLIALWFLKSSSIKPRLKTYHLVFWVVFYAAVILLLPLISEFLFLHTSDPVKRAQAMERWSLYEQFWLAIKNGPLLGYGWNQISTAQALTAPAYPLAMLTEHTHNILLDLLIWNGPVIGTICILLIGIWIISIIVHIENTKQLFFMICSGFILVHAMLEYPHAYAFFLIPLGLLLGAASASIKSTKTCSVDKLYIIPLVIFASALILYVFYEYRIIEENHRAMRFKEQKIQGFQVEDLSSKIFLLTQLSAYIEYFDLEPTINMSESDIEKAKITALRFPYSPSLARYIFILALNNKPEEAKYYLSILKGLHKESSYSSAVSGLQFYAKKYPNISTLLNSIGQ